MDPKDKQELDEMNKMYEMEYMNMVLKKVLKETEAEYAMHSHHLTGWLYQDKPKTDCPCVTCYKTRRDEVLKATQS